MRTLLELNKYFIPYKKKIFIGIVFIIISNVAQIYIPLLLRDSIDGLQNNIEYSRLVEYALLILGAAIISGIFLFLKRQTIIVVSREIEYDLRQDFWSHLQKLPLRFFQNRSTGDLMAHATNDIGAVRMYIGPAIMYSVDTITIFLIVIVIITSISPSLTFYSLLPLPILSYWVYWLSKKVHERFMKIQEKFSELTTKAQENFSGIRVVKSYVRENSEINSFTKLSREYLDRNMDKVRIQAWFMPILFLISGLSIIIVILVGGGMVIKYELTLGEIFAFIAYLSLLIWPVIAFGWVANIIQQASASMKRLNTIMNEDVEISDTEITNKLVTNINGTIQFKNVSFRFRENLPYVLKNINLTIDKGSTVAIVGNTGVGKTALVNLISRLYDVTEGDLLIDGYNIKTIPLRTLRKNIGMVAQETFLFSDTLYNNILYGTQNGNKELVEKVSAISKLDKDVENFPSGYETILGERGITLSGGQKQRACLSRALAIDPKILILDDSFSAVDTNTEEEILHNLKDFMKDRTSIIISHRISTVKGADKIIVLQDGKIVEEGIHEQLVALNGIYADMHFKQLLEEELKELN